jgi:hypothetical protein
VPSQAGVPGWIGGLMSFSPNYFVMYRIDIKRIMAMRETGYHTSLLSNPAQTAMMAMAAYAGTAMRMMQTGSVLILISIRMLVQK